MDAVSLYSRQKCYVNVTAFLALFSLASTLYITTLCHNFTLCAWKPYYRVGYSPLYIYIMNSWLHVLVIYVRIVLVDF